MAQAQLRKEASPAQRQAARYINRELSQLAFIERILAAAQSRDNPLLDRLRFLALSSTHLDEFFQVRVAGLQEQAQASVTSTSPDGMSPGEQLAAIRVRVEAITHRQSSLFHDKLAPALSDAGVRLTSAYEVNRKDRQYLNGFFRERIFPVLTPLAVDPAHPFPYISHLSLNLAVTVKDPLRRVERFARVKVPPLLPRFIQLHSSGSFVPLEQVIAMHLQSLFPGMEVMSHHFFRVTRDADLDLVDSGAEDLLAAIQTELRRQGRTAMAVRLELDAATPQVVAGLLARELELAPDDVYSARGLLDLGGLMMLYEVDRPDLKSEHPPPATQAALQGPNGAPAPIFDLIRAGDVLVQHPYDSFTTSVQAFIEQAAHDEQVLAIKQTLYRTSGSQSPIATALSAAAATGKQVVALIELKARGDEQANIVWAQSLEQAGVHVVYGLVGLKTHAKVTLVVRQEGERIRNYVHIGTGNYNPSTAHFYEDLGLFTADAQLGADVNELFNLLTGYSRQRRYRKLLVAPTTLREGLIALIDEEATRSHGRIVFKINNLVDPPIIQALYRAAAAGTEIDLIVRSICCLRPGVKGLSERIRVRSIVGHYLEHSRILCFGRDLEKARYFIGSADLMQRNLDRRVEAVAPVLDRDLRARLAEILEIELRDDTLSWALGPDASWSKLPAREGVNAQNRMQELARRRADPRPAEDRVRTASAKK